MKNLCGCVIAFLVAFGLFLGGYFLLKTDKEEKPLVFFIPENAELDITIDGMPVYYQRGNIYPQTMNTLADVTIRVNHMEKNISVRKISKSDFIPIEIFSGGKSSQYKIQTLPQKFPKISLEKEHNMKKGYILTSFHGLLLQDPSYAVIFNTDGQILWYRGNEDIAMSAFHLQRHQEKGKRRYSMHVQTDKASQSYIRGKHLLMDETFRIMDEISVLGSPRHPAMPADEHEFVYIDDGHYIVLGYQEKIAKVQGYDRPVRYVSVLIQEQKDGQVIFEWFSDDWPELFKACYMRCIGSKDPDYIHMNSVFIDPKDNHLIVSLANGYTVLKIHRQTGEILWRLGGKLDEFSLTDNQRFYRQHDAYISDDGWLTLFDNQYLVSDARVLRLKIDEQHKKVMDMQSYSLSAPAPYMGSAQRMPDGGWFIGCGNSKACAARYIDKNAKTLFTLHVEKPYFSYRSYFAETLD